MLFSFNSDYEGGEEDAHRCTLSVTKVSKFDFGRSHSLFALRLVSFIQIALSVLGEDLLWSLDNFGVNECELWSDQL